MDNADVASSVVGLQSRLGVTESTWERHARSLRDVAFDVVFRAQRDTRLSKSAFVLLRAIRALQLIAFAFWDAADFAWNPRLTDWFHSLLSALNFGLLFAGGRSAGSFQTALHAAAGSALALAFVAAMLGYAVARASSRAYIYLPLRLVRLWTLYLEPVLLVPFTTLFVVAFRCASAAGGGPALAGSCAALTSPPLAAALAGGAFACLVTTSVLTALTFFPRAFSSDAPSARAHGRAHAAETVLTVLLVSLFCAGAGGSVPRLALAALATATAAALLAGFALYIPYYRPESNAVACAQYAFTAWAFACLVVTQAEASAASSSAGIALYMGAIPVALLGAFTADRRAAALAAAPVERLASAFAVEAKIRPLVARAVRGHAEHARRGRHAYAAVAADDGAVGGDGDDWQAVESLLQRALEDRPGDPLLNMLLCILYEDVADNGNLALLASNRAAAAQPAVDILFYLFARQRVDTDAQATRGRREGDGDQMDPLQYLAYEHHMKRAAGATHAARTALVRLWTQLDEEVPDLGRISDLGAQLYASVRAAQAAFAKVLTINASSPAALRQYATFLMEVLNDSREARVLLQQADEIEESRAKEHQRDSAGQGQIDLTMNTVKKGDRVDLYDDRNGIVTLSSDSHNLGEMLSVNNSFAKMLGYKRQFLTGRDINITVPPPFSFYHGDFLRRYLRTRKGIFMNNTRPAFALNSRGFLTGVMLTLRESSSLGSSDVGSLQRLGALESTQARPPPQSRKAAAAASAALRNGDDLTGTTPGMRLVGVIQPLDKPELDVAFVDADGKLTAVTKHVPVCFGFSLEDVQELRVSVDNLFHGGWDPVTGSFRALRFTYLRYSARTRRVFFVPVEVSRMNIAEVDVYLMQMKLRHRDVTMERSVTADFLDPRLPEDWLARRSALSSSSQNGAYGARSTSPGSHISAQRTIGSGINGGREESLTPVARPPIVGASVPRAAPHAAQRGSIAGSAGGSSPDRRPNDEIGSPTTDAVHRDGGDGRASAGRRQLPPVVTRASKPPPLSLSPVVVSSSGEALRTSDLIPGAEAPSQGPGTTTSMPDTPTPKADDEKASSDSGEYGSQGGASQDGDDDARRSQNAGPNDGEEANPGTAGQSTSQGVVSRGSLEGGTGVGDETPLLVTDDERDTQHGVDETKGSPEPAGRTRLDVAPLAGGDSAGSIPGLDEAKSAQEEAEVVHVRRLSRVPMQHPMHGTNHPGFAAHTRANARIKGPPSARGTQDDSVVSLSQPLVVSSPAMRSKRVSLPPSVDDPGAFDDSASAHSESDADTGSTGSSSNVSRKLHSLHAVIQRTNSKEDKSLTKLRRVLISVLMTFILLAAADAGISHLLFTDYSFQLDRTIQNNRRFELVGSTLLGTFNDELRIYGLLPLSQHERTRKDFAASLSLLTTIHNDLYSRQMQLSTLGQDLETYTLVQLRGNATVSYTANTFSALYEFIAKASLVYEDETRSTVAAQLAMAFLRFNSLTPITSPLSTDAANSTADHAKLLLTLIQYVMLGLFACKLIPLIGSMFCGFIPAMNNIETTKIEVLKLFLEVPRSVVRVVLERQRNNLARAEQDGDEVEEGMDSDEDIDAVDALDGSLGSGALPRRGVLAPTHDMAGQGIMSADEVHPGQHAEDAREQARHDTRKDRRRDRRDQRRRKTMTGRMFAHSRASYVRTVFKFACMWVGIAVYFAIVFGLLFYACFLSQVIVANVEISSRRAAYLPYAQVLGVYYSTLPAPGQQNAMATNANLSSIQRESFRLSPIQTKNQLFPRLDSVLTGLLELDDALVYGSDELGTSGLRDDTSAGDNGEIEELSLRDACTVFKGTDMYGNCTSVQNGVLRHGLQSAIRAYVEGMREVILLSESVSTGPLLHSEVAMRAELLEAVYLRPIAVHALKLYSSQSQTIVDLAVLGVWMAAAAFVVLAGFMYMAVFRKMVAKLDLELRQTRSMLLLIPADVTQKVPAIRSYVLQLTQEV